MSDAATDRFISRLASRLDAYRADGSAVAGFLARFGANAVSAAKTNAVRARIVDTGRLLNSLGFKLETGTGSATVTVGAFGVRYAALHEFGMHYTPLMLRAMFASLHARGLDRRPGKGILAGGTLPPRPYLRPAFEETTKGFAQQLRDYVRSL